MQNRLLQASGQPKIQIGACPSSIRGNVVFYIHITVLIPSTNLKPAFAPYVLPLPDTS
jgi:hypothetical protein